MQLEPPKVLPFYFGDADRPLFGCYHQPPLQPTRNCAVVICQPIGHEYIYSHRALRQLATLLCNAGFPVLRFDYYGCGDSAGREEEGGINQWLDDISKAIAEVRVRSGLAQICLVGLRLGAALSMIAAAQCGEIDSLVFWDAVVTGKTYLRELLELQKESLRLRPKPARGYKLQDSVEVIGFPLSSTLYEQLDKLDLLAISGAPAKNILTIHTDREVADIRFKIHLKHTAVQFENRDLEAPPIWRPTADGSLLIPAQVLQSVVSWSCKTYA
jgi:alpha/beta superfamily hydrolase